MTHSLPTALSINLNKIALVRNSRHNGIPSVMKAGLSCLQAGAAGLTVHPRPDERHIKALDVRELHALIALWNTQAHLPERAQAEFNIEGNPFHNLMEHVRESRPTQATFVPDSAGQLTSDHGWALDTMARSERDQLENLIAQAHQLGVRVSLFMDAIPSLMPLAKSLGADRVELYTERYAQAHGTAEQSRVLAQYAAATQAALAAGLQVNAGHDLSLANLSDFLRACPQVQEVSIGHAFVADALELGYSRATQAYLNAIAIGHGFMAMCDMAETPHCGSACAGAALCSGQAQHAHAPTHTHPHTHDAPCGHTHPH